MSAACNLEGQTLTGERAGKQWIVQKQIQFAEGQSPGHFSVGYRVTDEAGEAAFLKAIDLRMSALGDAGFLERLKSKVDAHTFERQVLDYVRGANMDRVVVALDYGNKELIYENSYYTVLFLVFELAEHGDLRRHVNRESSLGLLGIVNALHNLANAIQQLHSGKVCHNDIKPGNFLVFNEDLQKLGDLGRATTPLFKASHDIYMCAGDPQYAPPEQIYNASSEQIGLGDFDCRRVGDLYSLGSIAHFMLTTRMITPELIQRLDRPFWPIVYNGIGWGGGYDGVLPHVQLAWGSILEDLRGGLAKGSPDADVLSELVKVVAELGEPDPRLRGRRGPGGVGRRLDVQYYISLFDRLRKQIMVSQGAH